MSGSRIEMRLGGTGGQGLLLSAKILADALAASGKRVAQSQTYEPTSRGGFCNADLVISDGEVDFPLATAIDQLVLLDRLAVKPSWPLLKPGALVIADTRLCPELPAGDYRRYHLPLSRTALELGSERVTNIVALGALVALSGICGREQVEQAVRAEAPRGFLDLNIDALKAGYDLLTQEDGFANSPEPPARPLRDGIYRGPALVAGICQNCKATYFPKPELCVNCHSDDIKEIELGAECVLFSFTTVHPKTAHSDSPYSIGYVDFPEGVRVFGPLDVEDTSHLHIGMPLRVEIGLMQHDGSGTSIIGHRFVAT